MICDDKDTPWINNRIEKLIHEHSNLYKDYRRNNNTQIFEKLIFLQKKLHLTMGESKDTYYTNLSRKIIKVKLVKQKSNPGQR